MEIAEESLSASKNSSATGVTHREIASNQARSFLSTPILEYAKKRNFDYGYSNNQHVSGLSKYISHRILSEYELIRDVLSHHSYQKVEKFIQEIFWRIYWKGWLETRPSVWSDFVELPVNYSDKNLDAALVGQTGIECFDSWVTELIQTNNLHNHSRMWFASIWIFTLGLPWQLGARFFLEHLIDGDAASNTLSWRWVAGLQTKGKQYQATSQNIEFYTSGRFKGSLPNESASPKIEFKDYPITGQAPPANEIQEHDNLLVFENDLYFRGREKLYESYKNIFVTSLPNNKRHINLSNNVLKFKSELTEQFCRQFNNATLLSTDLESTLSAHNSLDVVYPFIGENLSFLDNVKSKTSIRYSFLVRNEDSVCMQYCRKGFFQFKKNIPKILEDLQS